MACVHEYRNNGALKWFDVINHVLMLQQAKNDNACYSVGHSVSSNQHLIFYKAHRHFACFFIIGQDFFQ